MHKILFGVFMVSSLWSFGQNNPKEIIENWKALHPDMKIISVEEYKKYNDIDKLALSQIADHIVYDRDFKQSDIDAYEDAVDKMIPRTDVEYIFLWKHNHPNVKVLSHSYFVSLSSTQQIMYKNNGAMILLGEEMTKADINLFEN